MTPRRPKEPPGEPQEVPREPQEAPRGAQGTPKRTQERPKAGPRRPQDGPKTVPSRFQLAAHSQVKTTLRQDAPRRRPKRPKEPQEAPKRPPRSPQEAPRGPQEAPRGPQKAPKRHQNAPKTLPQSTQITKRNVYLHIYICKYILGLVLLFVFAFLQTNSVSPKKASEPTRAAILLASSSGSFQPRSQPRALSNRRLQIPGGGGDSPQAF